MRLVGIKSVTPGDKLAAPVCSASGKVILNAGAVVSEAFLNKLKQIGINKVFIDDERFNDVELMESLDRETRNKVTKALNDTYTSIQKGKGVDEYLVKDVAKNIVDYARDTKEKGVSTLFINVVDEYIIEHSINVAILAAFIGNNMNYNFNQLCDLVTGALIHDLGRENTSKENPDHVQKGFDVMRKCRGLSLLSSIVCYEHHENYDGTGYPRKLKGAGISEFSRIIRLADYYDNILHGYENKNTPVMPHEAYENVLAVSGKILDPNIVEMFRDTIIFYPNGCTVALSNGMKGVVIKQNLGSPQRPIIRAIDERNARLEDVDLFRNLTVFVQDVIVI